MSCGPPNGWLGALTRSEAPVVAELAETGAYATVCNGVFTSPDGQITG